MSGQKAVLDANEDAFIEQREQHVANEFAVQDETMRRGGLGQTVRHLERWRDLL